MSSIGDISGISARSADYSRTTNERVQLEVFEREGQVLVQSSGRTTAHLLADTHCYDCTSAFSALQSKAEAGEDEGGLFDLAVEQTDRAKRILGAVAQPGPGPLEGLSAKGAIRATDPGPFQASTRKAEEKADSVTLSRSALNRSAGVEVASTTVANPSSAELRGAAEETEETGSQQPGAPGAVLTANAVVGASESQEANSNEDDNADEAKKNVLEAKLRTAKQQLSDVDQKQVAELQKRDAEVRAHEQAHKSAAGGHAGAISLSYQTGPDGKKYAVGGSVPVDISPVKGDPAATIQKMQVIQRAALAPAEPSSADRRVAARASQTASKARIELQAERKAELEAPKKPGGKKMEAAEAAQAAKEAEDRTVNGGKAQSDESAQPVSGPGGPEDVGPNATGATADGQVNSSRAADASNESPLGQGGGIDAPQVGSPAQPSPSEAGNARQEKTNPVYSVEEREKEQQVVDAATKRPEKAAGGLYSQGGQFGRGGGYGLASLNVFA